MPMLDIDERLAQLGFLYNQSPIKDYATKENKGSLKGTSTDDPIWCSSQESIAQTIRAESSQATIDTLVPEEVAQPAPLTESPSYITISSSFLGLEWKIPSMTGRAPGGENSYYPFSTFLKNPIVSKSGYGQSERGYKSAYYDKSPSRIKHKIKDKKSEVEDRDNGSRNSYTDYNREPDEEKVKKEKKNKKKDEIDFECDPESAPDCSSERTKGSAKTKDKKANSNRYESPPEDDYYQKSPTQEYQECSDQGCPRSRSNYPERQQYDTPAKLKRYRTRSCTPRRVCSNCQHVSQTVREPAPTKCRRISSPQEAKRPKRKKRYEASIDRDKPSDYVELANSKYKPGSLKNPLTVTHRRHSDDELLPHESFDDEYVRRRTTRYKQDGRRVSQRARSNETLMEKPLKSYRYCNVENTCQEPKPPRKRCPKCNKPKSKNLPPPSPAPMPNQGCCPMCGLYGMIPHYMMPQVPCIAPHSDRLACGCVKKKKTLKKLKCSCASRMVPKFPPDCCCIKPKKTPKPIFKIICRPRARKPKHCPKRTPQEPCRITIHKIDCDGMRCRGGKLTPTHEIERSVLPHMMPVRNSGHRGAYAPARSVRRITSANQPTQRINRTSRTLNRPSTSTAIPSRNMRMASSNSFSDNDSDDTPSSSREAQMNETQRNLTRVNDSPPISTPPNAYYRGSFLQVRSSSIHPNRAYPVHTRRENNSVSKEPYMVKDKQLRSVLGVTQNSHRHRDERKPTHNSTGFLVPGRVAMLRRFHSCCSITGKSPNHGFKLWKWLKLGPNRSKPAVPENIPSAPSSDESRKA